MGWLLVVLLIVIVALPVLRGAPWLPTRKRELTASLRLLDLSPGQTVIDLGSGTGDFLVAAARKDLVAIGYEINPVLWVWSLVRTWRYRKRVRIILGDYWMHRLPPCDGLYVFLIEHYMSRLEKKLSEELAPGTKVVSYVFQLPHRRSHATSDAGLYLYHF